jgi:hypothetical protein
VVEVLCRKPEGSKTDEVNEFFSICLIPPAPLNLGVDSASNRNEYQKQKNNIFMGSKARTVREADNLTAICEPIV